MLDLGPSVCCKNCKHYYGKKYCEECHKLRGTLDVEIRGDACLGSVSPWEDEKFFCQQFEKKE